MQIESPGANRTPVHLFYSYAPEDEALHQQLEQHLTLLQRQGFIHPWSNRSISAGTERQEEIAVQLNKATIILLLLSPSFIAADFCYGVEMKRALERHHNDEVRIIPIILRPCEWQYTPLSSLEPLPTNGKPITQWPDRDNAFLNVAAGIRQVIETLPAPQTQPQSQLPTNTPPPSPRISTIPFARNPYFTGRENILKQLHNALNSNKPAALTQTQAISGLGGLGKTQTAVEYAYRHENDYTNIFWIRAEKREELISDFAALATPLNLPQKDEQDQSLIVAAVQKWLAINTSWLLIFDNADDLLMAKEFIPSPAKGHVILTTRSQIPGRLARKVEIEKMGSEEGTLFLLHRTGILDPNASLDAASPADIARAKEIVQALDGLPLALDQAAAYIEETECGLVGYLQRYQTQRNILLQQRGDLVFEHPEPVATTWKLSFQKVEQVNPAAADLLRLCAFLAPDTIPEEIFVKGAAQLGPNLQSVAADPVQLDMAIKELRKYSLVKRDPDVHVLNVHRLVQAVLTDEMDQEMQKQWAERAVRAVVDAFPNVVNYETWPACERLLPHARVCIQLIEQWKMEFAKVGRLLNRTGWYLRERLQYAEAEPLFQKSLALPKRSALASSMNNLGLLYQAQGKYAEAKALYQRALAIQEKTLGLEHQSVASSLNNLAELYRIQGEYAEAKPLYQRALAIREKVLVPDHPDVAQSLNNLALLYQNQGQYTRAEPLYRRALAIYEKVLAPDHPSLAGSLHNLARLYHDQGKDEEAEPLYQRALAIVEKTLGVHPNVALCLDNYAGLLEKMKREDEAAKLRERAKVIREKHARENLMKGD